jgi:outer membrane immunogenic protein
MHKFQVQLLATTAILALSGAAYAADMAVKAPPPMAPAPPVTNWTGPYVGVQLGGAAFDPSCHTTEGAHSALPCASSTDPTSSFSSTSFAGGGKIGYDYQWGKVVLGVVGDFDWTNLNGTQLTTFTGSPVVGTANEKIDWLASARGRLGWAFDNVLFYATGGVAWTQAKFNLSVTGNPNANNWTAQASSNLTGVVAGGGFEYRLTQNVSVVGEVLWYDFGGTTITVPGATTPIVTQFNAQDVLVGTLGANWRF